MQAVAKPDGRDMSVSDAPFNWNAQLDVRKLRVGLHQGVVRRDHQHDGQSERRCRCSTPCDRWACANSSNDDTESYATLGGFNVESAAYFDELARSGRMKLARGGGRQAGRLMSAVDYLQSQRVRMMMMMRLAEATKDFDVYIVASNNNPGAPGAAGGTGWCDRCDAVRGSGRCDGCDGCGR